MENYATTFEQVWANLDRISAEAEKRNAEADRRSAEADKRMKKLEELYGSMSNNNGLIEEEYFFNSFERGQTNFFGEKFDDIRKNIKGIEKDDEYDILLINGKTVGIIEVKYKAHENDLPKVLGKAESFRINFPKYANHRIYLGLATPAFYAGLEEECIKRGIAVIKQSGNAVIINDKHLKAY
jgi:hypothetical protein